MSRNRERRKLFSRNDKLEPALLRERINNAIRKMNQKYQ